MKTDAFRAVRECGAVLMFRLFSNNSLLAWTVKALPSTLCCMPKPNNKKTTTTPQSLTREDALAVYAVGQEAVVDLLLALDSRVQHLEGKLAKNSSNSSKPPSSDIVKPKKKKGKNGKKRKIGAQPGHKKNERPPFPPDEIDQLHEYHLEACPVCNHSDVTFMNDDPRIIQQMELEKVLVVKSEHRSYPYWCKGCNKIHYHSFPANVVKEGLFKERITALVAYMKVVDHASFNTIKKFILDVLGEDVSTGYLRKVIEKVSKSLDAPYQELLDRLPFEQKLNVDETGHKENGERFWTWVFRAELYVLFKIDKSRGSQVLLEVLGKEFNGVLGCDYFSAYHKYMKDWDVSVQFCIAHLIRDMKYLTELRDAETKAYGKKLLSAIKAMFKIIHNRDSLDTETFDQAMNKARETILSIAINEVPSSLDKNGKEQKKKAFNMAKRFKDNGEAYFKFITTPGVDPTNNLAEQAVRFIVIDRLITQGTRSEKGRKSNERLWTVVGTCSMQGRSAYEFIQKAVSSYFRNETAPSLLAGFT